MKNSTYNFIICGTGCAGLTLFYELLPYCKLHSKKILLIDKKTKTQNDRTWCFWETKKNELEQLIVHQWQNLLFTSNSFSSKLSINPYNYKMLLGIDFYTHILNLATNEPLVNIVTEDVLKIYNEDKQAVVETSTQKYVGNYIFNSIIFDETKLKTQHSLLQHFKGMVIETEVDTFDPSVATFMDFNVSQLNGTTFMYVMPTTTKKALVEYTLFTKNILEPKDYETAIATYISENLNIKNYTITHQEFGIIPMTDFIFPSNNGNIINIGTAAGWVKPSSGYAFKNIQKQTKKIVALIKAGKPPIIKRNFADKKFHFYDSVLLEVIATNKMNGGDIFAMIFKKNPPQRVLKFLDNETNLFEDLKIMASVPMKIFLPIAFRKLVNGKW